MKINGNEIRTGNVIQHQDGLWVAVKTNAVKPGKGPAYNQVELKNLIDDPSLASRVSALDARLDAFFSRYADSEYDLWRGGIAKGSVVRPGMFRKLYGPDWRPRTDLKPAFSE